jgi:hypothetical protein
VCNAEPRKEKTRAYEKIRSARLYQERRVRILEEQKAKREALALADPARACAQTMFYNAKNRSKHYLKMPFGLSDFPKIPQLCPLCEQPLAHMSKGMNAASLDRIDSTRGYTDLNTWVICRKCNIHKNALALDLMARVLREAERRGLLNG